MKKISTVHLDSPQDNYYEDLYNYMNEVFISRPTNITEAFSSEFIDSLIQRCGLDEVYKYEPQNYNVVTRDQCIYIFQGYPDGDLLKQVARVLELWNENKKFPVKFVGFHGLEDDTHTIVNSLAHLTPLIQQIFTGIKEGMRVKYVRNCS